MSADVVVQKYSGALFAACEETKKTEVVLTELQDLTKLFLQKDVLGFFTSPFNQNDNKVMVAKSALEGKCSPETFNFLITLVQNDRVALLQEMTEALQALVRAKGGETEGTLYVADSATEEFKKQVESKLSQTLGKKVKLSIKKESSLISGYKVSLGGWIFDDSAQFHLNKIKEEILKRGI